jgi:hypothetical protein
MALQANRRQERFRELVAFQAIIHVFVRFVQCHNLP